MDLKPQNVLVEQRPDGRLRPVLMDFGLARDVRSRLNLTETGIVLGTPEYMSPEQARGTSGDGSVDCRTDVYSLGAMLYELLVGQPPFEGSSSVQVLISVINDNAIPVRERNPSVPEPLETIVMKCLSKYPDGRYPTARALAEDLGRYLAAEPILAQPEPKAPPLESEQQVTPEPLPYRLIAAVLAAILVLMLAALLTVGLRSRLRQAAARRFTEEQARHAVLFEKDVRAMELFMRAAYELPLHNIRSEQDQIRQQVSQINAQLATLGPAARGPGEYALGRAAMVLDDWAVAEHHLLEALQAGYRTPEVHFALGLTYGVRYQRAVDEARRNPDPVWTAQRLRDLETQFLVPARTHLEQSGGVMLESPAYAQALLQYHRRQFDGALASVARAAGEAPWLTEIVQLEARLLRERAAQSNTKELMLFAEYDLKRAGESLLRALEMARSNPFLYLEQAELALMVLRQELLAGLSVQKSYAQVITACQKALVAQPDLALVYGLMASAEACLSEDQLERGEDPRAPLERGQTALGEAQRLAPFAIADLSTANRLNRVQIAYHLRRGRDAMPALLRATEAARAAAQKNPNWAALWVDLGRVHLLRADYQSSHGQEERPDLDEAITAFRRALLLQPQEAAAHAQKGLAELQLARRGLSHGEDPMPYLHQALQSFSAALAVAPENVDAVAGQVHAKLVETEYKLIGGSEPLELSAAAVQSARAAARKYVSNTQMQRTLAQALRLEAQTLLALSLDPTQVLGEGLQTVEVAKKLRASDPDLFALEGELHLLAAYWQRKQRRSAESGLRQARTALESSLQLNERRAQTYILLGRLALFQAESDAQEAAKALAQGLGSTAKALDIAPGSARALLVQGELLLAQALRAPVGERPSVVDPALAALTQALKLNPLLGREAISARERAQELSRAARGQTSLLGAHGVSDQKKR